MKVAIVILNWNGKKILEQFLPSVVEYSEKATIYVADNASTDKSISYIKEKFNKVTIIQNKTNGINKKTNKNKTKCGGSQRSCSYNYLLCKNEKCGGCQRGCSYEYL